MSEARKKRGVAFWAIVVAVALVLERGGRRRKSTSASEKEREQVELFLKTLAAPTIGTGS